MSEDKIEAHAVELVRTIRARPAQVYHAFLDPGLLARWFGPADFTVLDADVDARVGGRHRVRVAGPSGITGVFDGEILELVAEERIALSWSWVSDDAMSPPQAGSVLTITLAAVGEDSTELRLRHERLNGAPAEDPRGIADRWRETLLKLQWTFHER